MITEEYISDRNRITELSSSEEMLIVPILVVYNETTQAIMLKSMVLNLGWFNSDKMKFEDWWRRI